jgi:hypothetical protein
MSTNCQTVSRPNNVHLMDCREFSGSAEGSLLGGAFLKGGMRRSSWQKH